MCNQSFDEADDSELSSGEERIRNTGYDTGSIVTGYDTGYLFLVDPYPAATSFRLRACSGGGQRQHCMARAALS